MRLAFVIPSITAGGAERVVVRLANFMCSRGLDVFIFQTSKPDINYGLDAKVELITLANLNAPELGDAIKKYKIDLVSDHYHWSLDHLEEMAKLAREGVRIVLSEHNSYFYPLFQMAVEGNKKSLDLYYRRNDIYKEFSAVTSLTRYSVNLLASEGVDNAVLCYNPLSYDTEVCSDLSSQRVLTVSSFVKLAKRIDLLFDAYALASHSHPESRLRLVGELDYSRYNAYLAASGLNRNVVEPIGLSDNVQDHYLASSVFAMTSEIEGQPMVLLEAALHGLPQVIYKIPGLEDQVVDGETGYIIEREDTAGYADALVRLLKDKGLRKRMGASAREFVLGRFSLDSVGHRWLKLFTDCHEHGKPSPEIAWSLASKDAREVSVGIPSEMNVWFRHVLNPRPIPKVSVIVPVFGTEAYLSRCLESLIAQTFRDIEIIVVDDCSPGNAREIVETFQDRDNRVIYCVHEVNRGLYQARSTGVRAASGKYLAHVDSDDYVHPDFVRSMYSAALLTGADIVECQAVEVSTSGTRQAFNQAIEGVLDNKAVIEAYFNDQIRHVVWNKLYRRACWDRAPNHMNETREFSITEDLLRNTPIFLECKKYVMVKDTLYFYVRRENSIVTEGSFSRMIGKLEDVKYVYNNVVDLMRSYNIHEKYVERMLIRQVNDIIWYMRSGFSAEKVDTDQEVLNSLSILGIFGGVASSLSFTVSKLLDIERKYWKLVDSNMDLQGKFDLKVRELALSEEGRLWEKERADHFEQMRSR
ncbi:glycosyltransferase [Rhizobium sp.]